MAYIVSLCDYVHIVRHGMGEPAVLHYNGMEEPAVLHCHGMREPAVLPYHGMGEPAVLHDHGMGEPAVLHYHGLGEPAVLLPCFARGQIQIKVLFLLLKSLSTLRHIFYYFIS